MPFWGSPLLDPKKLQNQQFYIIDWIRKNSWSMLPIWLLAAMMIMMYYWRFWEPWANTMLAILLPKLWFRIENHDWHNSFWMSSWGSPLLDPKKLQNQQFYIIDWIRKKLLVKVANLATCCHDDYDVLLEVWEPCANAMLVVALVSQRFRRRARALAENDSPTRCNSYIIIIMAASSQIGNIDNRSFFLIQSII